MKAFLVNSNSDPVHKGPHCIEYMIRHNKVAAYYDTFNTQIDQIKKGDLVLLYRVKYGVAAVGCVVKGFDPHDYQDDMQIADEHWADVNWIWKASFVFNDNDQEFLPENYIMASEIGITMFVGVVINITNQLNYQRLLEEITKKQTYM